MYKIHFYTEQIPQKVEQQAHFKKTFSGKNPFPEPGFLTTTLQLATRHSCQSFQRFASLLSHIVPNGGNIVVPSRGHENHFCGQWQHDPVLEHPTESCVTELPGRPTCYKVYDSLKLPFGKVQISLSVHI